MISFEQKKLFNIFPSSKKRVQKDKGCKQIFLFFLVGITQKDENTRKHDKNIREKRKKRKNKRTIENR